MMKKTMIKALVMALALTFMLGFAPQSQAEGRKLRIVATVFPQYDWLRNILGDEAGNVELTLLQKSGADLHNFRPSAQDIMQVSSADVFVYIGGSSDRWVGNALSEAVNKEMVVVHLMQELGDGVKADISVEGMQEAPHDDSDDDHGHEEHEDHDHAHDDEHIWLSIKNAAALTQVLADRLSGLVPDYASAFQANAAGYIQRLNALDQDYQAAVDAAPVKTLLFADRFPFRYLMDDYGLRYYAAFPGCSAETEASFETVTFLADKVDELGLTSLVVLEGTDKRLANTILGNTRGKASEVLALDSMQSVDMAAITGGASYLGIMEQNLKVLQDALQ